MTVFIFLGELLLKSYLHTHCLSSAKTLVPNFIFHVFLWIKATCK